MFARIKPTRIVPLARGFSTEGKKPLLGKFDHIPIELYRIQTGVKVNLRDYDVQKKAGRTSFDVVLKNGLVLPSEGDFFMGPNGMSLRPGGFNMGEIVANFKGAHRIIEIPKDIKLPKEFILLHEHSDHYSLQTTVPITLSELNSRMTKFLAPFKVITKDEYFKKHPMM
mmetsp:Transcript_18707/g.26193  ORF Transcript_18707/g.26193 Transcript_18707/m.26193 type:complete len:169 (+) Transcript_18707:18-524(+)